MKKTLTISYSSSVGLDGLNLCMQFIAATNRYQTYFGTLEEQVLPNNPVRLIDAFINKLDLAKLP